MGTKVYDMVHGPNRKRREIASGSSNQRSHESRIMRLSTYGSMVDINMHIFQIGELIRVLIFGNADRS